MGKGVSCDQIALTVDSLQGAMIRNVSALDVITVTARDPETGISLASEALRRAGVSALAIAAAVRLLSAGPAPTGQNMRGAMIMDSQSGERMEQDPERGVRASRFDWSAGAEHKVSRLLGAAGLTHFRSREALALATKVAHAPGIIAELCWSDDPDYTAGYVASRTTGYVRFPFLKRMGSDKGGRAFFVDRDAFNMNVCLAYLQNEPVLISEAGTITEMSPEEFMKGRG
jgi:6-carboxyhexanoate--CoA ligase